MSWPTPTNGAPPSPPAPGRRPARARSRPAGGAFDIRRFEWLVFRRRREQAFAQLINLLEQLERKKQIFPLTNDQNDSEAISTFYTRLALGIVFLLADPYSRMPFKRYEKLAELHQTITAIFRTSNLSTTDYLFEIINGRFEADRGGNVYALERPEILKFLLSYSLYSKHELPWKDLFAHDPEAVLPIYLSLVRTRVLLDPDAERRRCHLLRLGDLIAHASVTNESLQSLRRAWMLCSYAISHDRHRIKTALNQVIQRWIGTRGYRSLAMPSYRVRKERPTLLVGAEVLRSDHAMFRCYASYFNELRTRFELVLLARKGLVDETSVRCFDRFLPVQSLREAIRTIAEIKPDMIFYPSLGMDDWTVLFANLRLAPIQMMSLGHPATSRSPFIDYVVLGTALFGEEERFSETVVLLRSSGNLFVAHPELPELKPQVREHPEPLRVGVVGKVMKLNAPFLALCRRICDGAKRPVQFVFFPGETGFSHAYCYREINKRLPDALVYPSAPYGKYLANLGRCDVRLGTFPFGGANSNVDAFLLGIPTVVYKGKEPHSLTDCRLVSLFDLPMWVTPTNEADYEAAALRLINDDETRISMARQILDADPYKTIYEKPRDFYPNDYLELFSWLYENHERIQASGKKVWTWEDRKKSEAAQSSDSA